MVRIKICGLTREADVDHAVLAGADAVGFIVGFPESPRNITLERAGALAGRVPPFVDAVLVTTMQALEDGKGLLSDGSVRVDAVQLYGEAQHPDLIRASLRVRLIRPYPARSTDVDEAKRRVAGYDALLVDYYDPARQGGSGIAPDWGLCRDIREAIAPVKMVLSGGLNPENVAEAMKAVRPFAVDVSSGVEEAPGRKDHAKILEFVRRARQADRLTLDHEEDY